jgi:hypothetical protein
MKSFKVAAFAVLAVIISSIPVAAQDSRAVSQEPDRATSQEPVDSRELAQDATSLPPSLSEPLEVDQRQANQVFTPPQRVETINNQSDTLDTSDSLIGPPAGSVTPQQDTPNRLELPIR